MKKYIYTHICIIGNTWYLSIHSADLVACCFHFHFIVDLQYCGSTGIHIRKVAFAKEKTNIL
jgi:hypothetical protein